METIKNISIYMTCALNLSDIKVTNQVKEQLEELFREGRTLQETNSNIGYEEARLDCIRELIKIYKENI